MTTMKEFAEAWKEFKERQQKVKDRNFHSEEYSDALKIIFTPNCRFVQSEWDQIQKIFDKDCYKDTIEGMFDWINDGKPQWGKKL